MEQVVKARSCGEGSDRCSACCFTHRNVHFKKPAGSWCSKRKAGTGCGIYGSHPAECRGYKCSWLELPFPDDMRPDRLGIVAEVRPEKVGERQIPIAQLWEVWTGALENPRAQLFIEGFKHAGCVVITRLLQPSGEYHDALRYPVGLLTPAELEALVTKLKSAGDED